MTDETQKTPEQLAAEAAAAASASGATPASEPATDPNASPEPPESPEVAAAEFPDDQPRELQPGQTLTALRGIAAGPAPHPRR